MEGLNREGGIKEGMGINTNSDRVSNLNFYTFVCAFKKRACLIRERVFNKREGV